MDLRMRWAFANNLEHPEFHFSDAQKAEMLAELASRQCGDKAPNLIQDLEGEIAGFLAWKKFELQQLKEFTVERHLTEFRDHCDALWDATANLDWPARRTLAPFLVGLQEPSNSFFSILKSPEMTELEGRLSDAFALLGSVQEAIALYERLPDADRQQSRERFAPSNFAFELARLLDRSVGPAIPIVSTEGATFENILRICLSAAQDGVVGDLRRAVSTGVTRYKNWKAEQPKV